MFFNTIIKGTGHYLPKNIVKNSDFMDSVFYDENGFPMKDSNEEIIRKFQDITEIEERRYLDLDMKNSDQATEASKMAIEDWGGKKEDIDYIIFAHNFGDPDIKGRVDIVPSLSARLKNKLGIKNRKCIVYDMIFGCPGWIEGMILGHRLIQSRYAKNILVVGSESLSRVVDPYDRNKMIFSDGAGAVVLTGEESGEKRGILDTGTYCDNQEELEYLRTRESLNKEYKENEILISMIGRKIYEYALLNVSVAIKELVDRLNFSLKDFKKLLIHQANAKMDDAILKRLLKSYKLSEKDVADDFMPMTINKHGNSSVATIPTMLDLILKGKLSGHKIDRGDKVLFASVGAGMHINAIAYKF